MRRNLSKKTTTTTATATKKLTESSCKMLSRQCLSTSTSICSSRSRSTCTRSTSRLSSVPSVQSRARRLASASTGWNDNWNLSLLALIIASGCLMLNAPEVAAFDIGEWKTIRC
ncbi:hypothetical protein KR222_010187 [Zaprionus bogoriensis]|nr:hypothetical protein KR222_010187 [Zaprionus bogoriensis]